MDIVTAEWLNTQLTNPDIIILDARLVPLINPNDTVPTQTQCIPNARKFNIGTNFSDPNSKLSHSMLEPKAFTKEMRSLGISKKDTIVIYDKIGIYSSPRA
jgi:thiosulfate/3-mercaptopyruvate sulfurtransferase